MKSLKVKIEGVSPLLLHSGRTKDPTDKLTKEMRKITSKRNKTDADFEELKRLEFLAGLYFDADNKIYMPDINIERSIYEGAKLDRNGKKFLSGFMVNENAYLENGRIYTVDKILDKEQYYFTTSVSIQRNSVMRTRPRFNQWGLDFTCTYNESILNQSEVSDAIVKAGQLVGLGDWRPKFGRFRVLEVKDI